MKSQSSTWRHALSIAISLFLMLFIQSVHQAYAASCFTDTGGYWAEPFICWMKTTGLSSGYSDGTFRPNNDITRAEVAALLYKEASGDTYVNLGPSGWQVDAGYLANAYIQHTTTSATLRSTATGFNGYLINLPLVTTLHNQQMTAKGAKLCYSANAAAPITQVFVGVADSGGATVTSLVDSTVLTDKNCRVYLFSTPAVLGSSDSLFVYVVIDLSATSNLVQVYGVTAIQGFSPTAGVLAPSPSLVGPLPPSAP